MAEIKMGRGLPLQLSFLTALLHLFWSVVTLWGCFRNGFAFVIWLVSGYGGHSLVSVVMAEIEMGHHCCFPFPLQLDAHPLNSPSLKSSQKWPQGIHNHIVTNIFLSPDKKSGPPTNISLTVTNFIDPPIKTASKSSLKLFCHKSRRITWPAKTDESANHSWSAHIRHVFRPWSFSVLDLCIHKNWTYKAEDYILWYWNIAWWIHQWNI